MSLRFLKSPGLNKNVSPEHKLTDTRTCLSTVADTIDEVKLTQLADDGVSVFGNTSAL